MADRTLPIVFEGRPIRNTEHEGETWYSIFDILEILTETSNPKRYWNDLKRKDTQLDNEGGTKISYPLKMQTKGGRQNVLCANTEGVLRLIMSVPSPKAEPFKKWMAELGKRELEEIADPELGFERMREIYQAKGYSEEWIKNRLQTISTRKELTNEWQKRGVKEGQEYAILTASVAKGTFGVTPSDHSKLKNLAPQHNLRDHMTPLELIFTALGEELTRMETVSKDAQGFNENLEAANEGGRVAGVARRKVEKEKNIKIVSPDNFLELKTADKPTELPPQ